MENDNLDNHPVSIKRKNLEKITIEEMEERAKLEPDGKWGFAATRGIPTVEFSEGVFCYWLGCTVMTRKTLADILSKHHPI